MRLGQYRGANGPLGIPDLLEGREVRRKLFAPPLLRVLCLLARSADVLERCHDGVSVDLARSLELRAALLHSL